MMQTRRKRKQNGSALVSATEVASFVYCPEQWRLEHGLGLEAANRNALDAGTRHHARKAVAERVAGALLRLGSALIVAAAVIAVLLWLVWR
jgi:hypothetical protein